MASNEARCFSIRKTELAEGGKVITIGGRLYGSCIIKVGNYVPCGDECYSEKNLTDSIMTASSICTEKSLAFIKEYRKSCCKPIIFHSPSAVGYLGNKVICETEC